jgi:hypothetical protein
MKNGGGSSYTITVDVDWAPDWCIRAVSDILIEKGVRSTWFITHACETVKELYRNDLFELGIHPNFQEGSTHGRTPEQVMEHMLGIVPGARTVRPHGLVQSTALYRLMVDKFGIRNDSALFLPLTPSLRPHQVFLSSSGKGLLRFPYFWEDDVEMYSPRPSFTLGDRKYKVKGMKIFDFHVIHILLNSLKMETYEKCRAGRSVPELRPKDISPHIKKGRGTGTLFRELVDKVSKDGSVTISDLARKWRKGHES